MSSINYLFVKRLLDVFFAALLIFLNSPVILIIAIALKLSSPSESIVFCQTRPGLNGKPFVIYKFRTMISNVERNGKYLSDKERLTRLGKFLRKSSLDEILQLINILKGQMSFIGPRPLLIQYLPYYTENEKKRHDVLPGLSGWAQVNGRNNLSWTERLSHDVYYVENLSFLFDLKILLHTFLILFSSSNIILNPLPDLNHERASTTVKKENGNFNV